MAFTKEQLDAYIQALYDNDGQLSNEDYQLVINYILSNGEPDTNPRDLIQIRRGNEADLPELAQGELAYTLDNKNLYIGDLNGNTRLTTKEIIDVRKFGAKGDGVTDDTNAIKAAIESAQEYSVLFIPEGRYLISDTILVEKNIHVQINGVILYAGSKNKAALHFKRLLMTNMVINKIMDVSDSFHGWVNNDYVGVLFENLIYCDIHVKQIANFTTGVRFKASGGISVGHFFNNYKITQCYNNKTQMEIYLDGEASWFNANVINDTIFTYEQVGNSFQTAVVDRYCIKETHVNGNTVPIDTNLFYNLRFDLATTVGGSYTGIYLERARFWRFENYRAEIVSATNAKMIVLNNENSQILGCVFSPVAEFRTLAENVTVHLQNNSLNNVAATSDIYTKYGVGENQLYDVYKDEKFSERFRRYQTDFNYVENLYYIDLTADNLDDEKTFYYGTVNPVNGGADITQGVIYIENHRINDEIEIDLSIVEGTNETIKLKLFNNSGAVIASDGMSGVKLIGSSSFYWDAVNNVYQQNINGKNARFSIKSTEVKTIAIIFSGKLQGYNIKSNNKTLKFLKSKIQHVQKSKSHVVHSQPTLVGDFEPAEVVRNLNTATGQRIGWTVINTAGNLSWTPYGTH